MLYLPWTDENELIGDCATYEQHYRAECNTIRDNEHKYTVTHVDHMDIDVDNPPEHAWDQLAPTTEANRGQSLAQGNETLTELSPEDLHAHNDLMSSSSLPSTLHLYERTSARQEIPPNEYRQLLYDPRHIVLFHRNWCKRAAIAMKQGLPIVPCRVFLCGPGGVGKSHVIKLIHSDTLKLLRLSGTLQPDDVTVLLTAPTGVAAFNIDGMTLHAAFLLGRAKHTGFQPLSNDRITTLRSKLAHLSLVIIDEVSIVGCDMLLEIHKCLQQIKGASPDNTFGGVSILAVGDLYQLPPVAQRQLFARARDTYGQLYRSGSLWVDEFQMMELTEIMRQWGDNAFAQLLCRVRTNEFTPQDVSVLKSRLVQPDSLAYPIDALHVYRVNRDVEQHNMCMLNKCAPTSAHYSISARDSQTSHLDLSRLSAKRSDTGGLHNVLELAVGARVMLTANVDVSAGLVNGGAMGEIAHIVANSPTDVSCILVNFDNARVGQTLIQGSPFRATFPHAVPFQKHEATFLDKGKRGAEVTRLQFPLTLAWATTIHSLILDRIVIDLWVASLAISSSTCAHFLMAERLKFKMCKPCNILTRLNATYAWPGLKGPRAKSSPHRHTWQICHHSVVEHKIAYPQVT